MLSFSDNELTVISFLVRNFSERLTIRNIAQRLNFSPAGVFNILKKLDREKIVSGEKLGTGLFYSLNFESKIAQHLAAIVLLYSEEKVDSSLIEQVKKFKAAIIDKKNLLVISDLSTEIAILGYTVISKSEDEILALLRKKDSESLQILRKGAVIHNEMKFVELIKNSTSRF